MDLARAMRDVRANGPKRVMINDHEATTPYRAKDEHGIEPSIVFLRDDGWTLGAPEHLRGAAQSLWADTWVAVMENYPGGEFKALTR